jgi:hypothetical protein
MEKKKAPLPTRIDVPIFLQATDTWMKKIIDPYSGKGMRWKDLVSSLGDAHKDYEMMSFINALISLVTDPSNARLWKIIRKNNVYVANKIGQLAMIYAISNKRIDTFLHIATNSGLPFTEIIRGAVEWGIDKAVLREVVNGHFQHDAIAASQAVDLVQ